MRDSVYRYVVCVLLSGILACLVVIVLRLPPTLGDLAKAPKEHKKEVMKRAPVIHSQISEPLQVDVANFSDLSTETLQVEISQ